MPNQTTSTTGSLDPQAVALAKAIRQVETGGDFTARGKSGEYGAYQYTKNTWDKDAKAVGVNVPLESATPEQQNEVAYKTIKSLKDQGYNPGQIASIWNSGKPDAYLDPSYKGTNKMGVSFNVPAYAKSVATAYQQIKQGQPVGPDPANPSSIASTGQDKSTSQKIAEFLFPVLEQKERTPLQWVGDTALSALTLIPGLGEAGLGGRATLLGLKGAKEAGLLSKVISSPITKGAAIGYGADVGSKLSQGDTDVGNIITPGAGTITGGILGGIGGKIASKTAQTASRTPEGRLVEQTNRLKTLQKSFDANSTRLTNPIKTLQENGWTKELKVNNNKVDATALTNAEDTGIIDNQIQTFSDEASKLVGTLEGSVPLEQFKNMSLEAIAKNPSIVDSGDLVRAEQEAERIFASYKKSYGDSLPWKAVDRIRVQMNKKFVDPATVDVRRTIGDAARELLYSGSATNKAIQAAMQNESELIKLRNYVEKLNGTTVPGGNLSKYFADTIGAMAGGAVGSLGGPIGSGLGVLAGGATADKMTGLLQKNYFNPLGASTAQTIQSAFKSRPGRILKDEAKIGLLKLISGQ